jgi:hypothetical protein
MRALRSTVFSLVALLVTQAAVAGSVSPVPIPQDPNEAASVPAFIGHPASRNPVPMSSVPQNPHLAPNGRSNIHDDAYQTDTYTVSGPLGRKMEVRSTFQSADCASVTFDAAGRIITICVGLQGPTLEMFAPRTLETLATFPLPPRNPGTGSPLTDFSGGGYFYLDDQDQAVIPTNTHQIWVVGETDTPSGPGFQLVHVYDVNSVMEPDEGIVSALPDWSGRIWFVTTKGIVGDVDPVTGLVQSLRLSGESIGNSFAVDETGGVFVVTDHAMYRFDADPSTGAPMNTWREVYDRGTRLKPGQVNFGSGTTPTLMGTEYVAITDNADPRMHVLVYRRAKLVTGSRLACAEPVFEPNKGATENSLMATDSSMIVENNYGYTGPLATEGGKTTEPGITRVDLDPGGGCHTVWTNTVEHVPSTVSKLSVANGLVYTYTKDPEKNDTDAWYFTAVSLTTGKTVFKRLAGTGLGYNNHYAPVSIAPDGTAYVGALGGLIELRDTVGRAG